MLPSELPELPAGTLVAVDVETLGGHPDDRPDASVSTLSLAWMCNGEYFGRSGGLDEVCAYAWPLNQGLREGKTDWKGQDALDLFGNADCNLPQEGWRCLLAWLSRRGRTLVFHNSPFDCRFIRHGVVFGANLDGTGATHWIGRDYMPQMAWDTLIAERELAEPAALIGLEQATQRAAITYQGGSKADESSRVKLWLRKNKLPAGRYDLVPWEIIEQYAAGDAGLTIRLAHFQRQKIAQLDSMGGVCARDRLGPRLEILHQRQRVLYAIESRGLPYDSAGSLAEAAKLQTVRSELAEKLPFRATDDAAKKYYFGPKASGGLEHPPYAVTEKTGRPQMDAEIVNRMVNDGLPHAKIWQQYSKIDTAISMWYLGYPNSVGPDGRLRCVFRPTKVVSGRMSVERVNLQAIPHDYRLSGLPEGTRMVRSFVRLPDGSPDVLVELDLAQAELRAAAVTANCDVMTEMIERDVDLHGFTATELFQSDPSDPSWFEYRQVAKRANFSLIFGSGAATFQNMLAKQVGIYWSLAACQEVVTKWNRLYDYRFKSAIDRCMRQVERQKWLVLMNGRVRRFSDVEVRFQSHKSFNQFIQGSLAEMVLDWMVAVEAKHPGFILNMVHDSLVVQVPKGPAGKQIVEDMAAMGKELFEQMWGIVGGVDYKLWNK